MSSTVPSGAHQGRKPNPETVRAGSSLLTPWIGYDFMLGKFNKWCLNGVMERLAPPSIWSR
jgi:hypothetical protein